MEKLTIKSVYKFCELAQQLSGKVTLPASAWCYSGKNVDVRFRAHDLTLEYSFQGGQDHDGCFLKGTWSCQVPAVCSRCAEHLDINLDATYNKIYLKDGNIDTLNCELETLECQMINFDILPWLLSEIIIQVPISPKHDSCEINPKSQEITQEKNKIFTEHQDFFKKLSNYNHQD